MEDQTAKKPMFKTVVAESAADFDARLEKAVEEGYFVQGNHAVVVTNENVTKFTALCKCFPTAQS